MSAESTHLGTTEADIAHVKRIWKAFWILLVLTILELALGLTIYRIDLGANPNESLVLMIKGVICILTLAKAFYIISIFMHLGDEVRAMAMTIGLPALLFIWFIIAFIAEGSSYRHLRNTDAGIRQYKEQPQQFHHPSAEPAEKSDKKLD
ncbi:MAG: cytochrome C oxidase subunit IV family protein [Bacteroidota bacterium]|nr:cytochrome C oxidase subunit IV family protein [Bacteroidota bacterium]